MSRRWWLVLGVMFIVGTAVVGLLIASRDDGDTASLSADYAPNIDPASFTTNIDNPFFPLAAGTQWVYEQRDDEGLKRIVVQVTPQTRIVMGVNCVVVRDTVTLDGKVLEDTYDWFAQDREGNVWYFGEDTTSFEGGGKPSKEGSWEAGVDGAKPGIVMKGRPQVGEEYRQEYYPGEAEDTGEVLSLGERVTVPFGSFDGVLKTKDVNPLDGETEHKYYASGVGLVLAESAEGSPDPEALTELTRP